jgi:hypothetical protein
VDKRKLMAMSAVPAVLTFGALGFASQQGSAQHSSQMSATQQSAQAENTKADPDNIQQGGGNQVEDGKPDLPGAAAEDGD